MARILIAEDERDIRELISFTLRFAGHDVIAVSNGAEAVAAAINELPDLVLMDVRMPRMTGYEACEIMKADSATAKIPVVFLSAKGQESEVKAGIEAGADEYIIKPFSTDELTARVKSILSQYGK
jgi:DNA-binding response OmpR family regulator